jgi:hypothetical protein
MASTTVEPRVLERRIAASADDAEEAQTGSVSLNSSDLELVTDGSKVQVVGLRFTNVDLPPGAIITNAHIQFTVDQVSTGASALVIRGQDSNDAAGFVAASRDVSSRPVTDASVFWTPADWTVRGAAGADQRTPDLVAVVQEIVDRAGWAALNDMAFLISGSGTRTARAFDSRPEAAPLLHIEYTLSEPDNLTPVVDLNGSAPGTGYAATFRENGAAVAVAGAGLLITDGDDSHLARATVTIANPHADDALILNTAGLPGGIAVDASSTASRVVLVGSATLADYETALRQVMFRNSGETPNTEARTIEIEVSDGVASSSTAITTIVVDAVPDAVDDTASTQAGQIVVTANVLANDDQGDGPASITAWDGQSVAGGGVVYNGNRTFTYTPPSGFTGIDAFTYTIADSNGDTSSATVRVTVSAGGGEPVTIEKRVASGADDVEERYTGSMSLTSSDLELTFDGTVQQTVGMRFTGVNIPKGAIVTKAYIQFTVDQVSTGAVSLLVRGQDSDDAGAFTGNAFNVTSRPTTDASIAWSPGDWTVRGESGLAQRTPDLAAIIQEIVDRAAWSALNDVVLTITGTGTRTARAYDSRPEGAPLLHVEFLPPGAASDPVLFNDPADANGASNQIAELAAAGTIVGITASAEDPDPGDSVTYSIDDNRFSINSSNGVITRSGVGTLDFEADRSITLTVTATSADRSTAVQTFVVSVLDSPEPVAFNNPPDADSKANRIVENAAAGTEVGITASAFDPDAGSAVTYSISDPRFSINPATGVVTRSGNGTLNAVNQPSITFAVTATSSDESTATSNYTVNVVPDAPQVQFRFAAFGDFGDSDLSGERAVADMVRGWNVDFILTVGDNAYGSRTLDNSAGQFYSDYIGNYTGAYGSGSTVNRFFPTLGNHDYEDSGLPAYLNYFTLPDNERYYDYQVGSVRFFALNSNKPEPDGRSATSPQGQWLQSSLASSDATFNVAYFHHTPYTPGGGTSAMRWPYENWGVDAVFAGHDHDYYRVMRDDDSDGTQLPYTTTGLGGAGESPPNVGASLVTVTDEGMLIEFYSVNGVREDFYFIEAPGAGSPLYVNGNDVMNGTAASDYLWGLGGIDTLIGGRGSDFLIGGPGNDVFLFHRGDGWDTVADFVAGAGSEDLLDLRAFGIDTAATFRQVAVNQGPNVLVDFGAGDRITLLGVHVEQFRDDDFRADLLLV